MVPESTGAVGGTREEVTAGRVDGEVPYCIRVTHQLAHAQLRVCREGDI